MGLPQWGGFRSVIWVLLSVICVWTAPHAPPYLCRQEINNKTTAIMDTINNKGISRREALKRMGLFMGSTALGMPAALTACKKEAKKRILFYFTATGNCLYVARQLADEHTELLSIPQLVKQGRYDFEADEIGIVYPIYGHMPPNLVRNFIQKAHLTAAYKFAVLTFGARKCNAVGIWDEITRKAGKPFDYITTMIMVDNWLPNFDMNEQMKMDKGIPANLERIRADLAQQRHWLEPFTEEERRMHEGFMAYTHLDPEVGFLMRSEKYFRITDACVGCAICTDVCPRGNYKLTSTGVKTEGDCDFCFACIQNCSQKAIQFAELPDDPLLARGKVNPNARYRNEHVSLWSIKNANRQ